MTSHDDPDAKMHQDFHRGQEEQNRDWAPVGFWLPYLAVVIVGGCWMVAQWLNVVWFE